jgi:hypothetical protein
MTVSNASQSKVVSRTTSIKHKTIRIVYGDQEADVDKQIAPLVKEMWKAGIETYQSCQDSPPGWVWIQFMSSHELERFLSIIGDYEAALGSLHDRMRHSYDRLAGPQVGQWRYVVVADDLAIDEVDTEAGDVQEICVGPPNFMLLIAVHFPHTDLAEVRRRMKRFNRNPILARKASSPLSDTEGGVARP